MTIPVDWARFSLTVLCSPHLQMREQRSRVCAPSSKRVLSVWRSAPRTATASTASSVARPAAALSVLCLMVTPQRPGRDKAGQSSAARGGERTVLGGRAPRTQGPPPPGRLKRWKPDPPVPSLVRPGMDAGGGGGGGGKGVTEVLPREEVPPFLVGLDSLVHDWLPGTHSETLFRDPGAVASLAGDCGQSLGGIRPGTRALGTSCLWSPSLRIFHRLA